MKRYQLFRFGEPYASWGTKQEVINRLMKSEHAPWWWLRIKGWHVGNACGLIAKATPPDEANK